ncbi:MAG: hypothetical protein HGA54_04825 [Actinobacteria bacterium]|nr:hypothetical protein [Actinomycetota bacterium]
MTETTFLSFSIVLGIAAVLGILATRFKQPLVLAFIAGGIILGVVGSELILDASYITLISEVAICILLFTVGLKLDAEEIKSSGKTVLLVAFAQMIAVAVLGFVIAFVLKFPFLDAVYIGLAVTFSSTIVVIKVLSDRDELDSLHGRIAVGVLIVQDIAVIVTMLFITALGTSTEASGIALFLEVLKTFVIGAIFVVAAILIGRFVLPLIMQRVARTGELLILFPIAWTVLLAAAGDALGFGKELGAFIAGLSLASSPFRETIHSRLAPIRDFFLIFFFVGLGLSLDFEGALGLLPAAVIISAIIIVGTPIIVTWVMGRLGYHRMTGFFTGLALSQISEFSLIIAALGVSYGQIGGNTLSTITLIAIITIVASTYLMRYAGRIYRRIARWLHVFQQPVLSHEDMRGVPLSAPDVIIFGMGRYGSKIALGLAENGYRVLGVDFDPRLVKREQTEFVQYKYGDVEDPELGTYIPVTNVKTIISAFQRVETTLSLKDTLTESGFTGEFVGTANNDEETKLLEENGIPLVLRPYDDAADQAVDILLGHCVLTGSCAIPQMTID